MNWTHACLAVSRVLEAAKAEPKPDASGDPTFVLLSALACAFLVVFGVVAAMLVSTPDPD